MKRGKKENFFGEKENLNFSDEKKKNCDENENKKSYLCGKKEKGNFFDKKGKSKFLR